MWYYVLLFFCRIHAYHPAAWGNWGFAVDDFTDGVMSFRAGGNQEARGCGQHASMGDRYFAGMFEELDSANEFYYDRSKNELYAA